MTVGTVKNRWPRVLPWLIGGFLVVYIYAFLVATTTSDLDLYECKNLAAAVLAGHAIPESKSSPGQPAVFCHLEVQIPFLIRYDKVYIYGVTAKTSQDSIADSLQGFRIRYHNRKILLQFFANENWQTWSNPDTGMHGGERGPETPIRLIWIK
jgi:hypothetical protein